VRALTQEQTGGNLAVSPSGGKVAYLSETYRDDPAREKVSLRLLSLPDGTIQTISEVLPPPSSWAVPTPDLEFDWGQAGSALGSGDWSPDGERLAFVSALDGQYTNVYVYDLKTGRITRMTDRPHYEYAVKWSPTGNYLFFSEAESFGGGGITGGGAWVIRADRPLAPPVWGIPGSDTTPAFDLYAWTSPDRLLLESYSQPCGIEALNIVDVAAGTMQPIWQAANWGDCIGNIIRDPSDGDFLLNQIFVNSNDLHIALLASNGTKIKEVASADLRTFLLQGDYPDGLSLEGSTAAAPAAPPGAFIPFESPDGSLWAWLSWPIPWYHTGGGGLWIGNPGEEPRLVYASQVDSFSWSPDPNTIFFCAGGNLYAAHRPDFNPEVMRAVQESPQFAPYRLDVRWVFP
jgi:WD40 repeat protein